MAVLEEVTDAEYQSLSEFRYQIRRFLHFSERAARAAGLEPQQHQLLLALRGAANSNEPPSIGTLAERLQIQHHSTVELVDRLVERGLVSRSRAPSDRRQAIVRLTARGEAELEKLAKTHLEELRSNGPALVEALTAAIRGTHGRN
ncbi:MAG TPA: MarR family transcriptional regulator [Bryobacteraceae bacterium]|nr:MarR family transcriptional regulator [Bryobacteraceae bacterium]